MREKFDASFVFIRAESREERKSKNKFLLMGSHIRRYLGKSLFIRNGTTHFTMVTKSVIWSTQSLGSTGRDVISLRVQPTERKKAKISEPGFVFGTLLMRRCSLVVKPTFRAAMKASTPFGGTWLSGHCVWAAWSKPHWALIVLGWWREILRAEKSVPQFCFDNPHSRAVKSRKPHLFLWLYRGKLPEAMKAAAQQRKTVDVTRGLPKHLQS